MADSDDSQRLNIDESSRSSYPLEKMRGGQGKQQREQAEAVHEQSGRVPPQAVDVEKSVLEIGRASCRERVCLYV